MPDASVADSLAGDASHNFGPEIPLVITIAHDELAEPEMFRMAFIIDGIGQRGDPYRAGRKIRETMTVDLVEMESAQTKLRLVPRRQLAYDQFHEYAAYLLERIRASTARNARLVRLAWEPREWNAAERDRARAG